VARALNIVDAVAQILIDAALVGGHVFGRGSLVSRLLFGALDVLGVIFGADAFEPVADAHHPPLFLLVELGCRLQ
jgi:hypothetical protein